ncbi:hypothetical protein AB1Y20_012578 [Prymnesium parvum]|uniref:Uncharacterized protein n=1 Tax=Prymnesium parvum TaxID=97485 RepID=A0AB34IL12_PRYPA
MQRLLSINQASIPLAKPDAKSKKSNWLEDAMGTVVKVFQGDKDPTLTRTAGGRAAEDESRDLGGPSNFSATATVTANNTEAVDAEDYEEFLEEEGMEGDTATPSMMVAKLIQEQAGVEAQKQLEVFLRQTVTPQLTALQNELQGQVERNRADQAAFQAVLTGMREQLVGAGEGKVKELEAEAALKSSSATTPAAKPPPGGRFYDRWEQRGVKSMEAARATLRSMERIQLKLDYLREQIEMRDAEVGTVDDLFELLRAILMEENERHRSGSLPTAAVVPQMRRKTFKELGAAKSQRLCDAGELDELGDVQPEKPPPCNDLLVGTMLEVCWRYWAPPEDPMGKRKKVAVDIWCEGEVVMIANGTTDKESPTCRKLLKAGAVRVKWPADKDRDEEESYTWCILTEANWNKEAVLGWRFSGADLKKRKSPPQRMLKCRFQHAE